jgi:hypothetical protein
MKKIFLLLLFCISSTVAFSQGKGSVIIDANLEEDYSDINGIEFILLKQDTIIKKEFWHGKSFDGNWTVDSIDAGNYSFKILLNDSLYFLFTNINSFADKKTYYDFNVSYYKSSLSIAASKKDSTIHSDKGEFTFGGMYGNNLNVQKNKILRNQIYSGEIAMNVYHTLFKHYSIGFKIGYQYSTTVFYNDTTHYKGENIIAKYYSYNDLNIGLINRFTFFNNFKNKDGLKLDLGVIYHFPVSFKQVIKADDDTKTTTKRIHNYNDFTAIVRLGYKYVGLQAEYSLTNFLRRSYVENPQLRLGLVFYIPLAVNG